MRFSFVLTVCGRMAAVAGKFECMVEISCCSPVAVKHARKPRFKNVLALVHYPGGCVINVHSSVV